MNRLRISVCLLLASAIILSGCDSEDNEEVKKSSDEKGAVSQQVPMTAIPTSRQSDSRIRMYTLVSSANQEDVTTLQKVSDSYAGYQTASSNERIQIDSVSVEVIAEIRSFPTSYVSYPTAGVQNVTLTPDEAAKAVRLFKETLRSHVADALTIDDSAKSCLVVVVKQDPEYGWSFIPSIGMGRIEGNVFLIRPEEKRVAFHCEIGRNGKDVNDALRALAENVKERLLENIKPIN